MIDTYEPTAHRAPFRRRSGDRRTASVRIGELFAPPVEWLLAPGRTCRLPRIVMLFVDVINEVHVSEPGLVVVDVVAADDATAFAFHAALAAMWVTTGIERTTRGPGRSGVRLRCCLDMRRRPG